MICRLVPGYIPLMLDYLMNEDIVLEIIPESRFGFEFFRFRSPEMVAECEQFIKYAKENKCCLFRPKYRT